MDDYAGPGVPTFGPMICPDPAVHREALPVPALDALREAAQEVVRLGNQPGLDDDEWEQAMKSLEEAIGD